MPELPEVEILRRGLERAVVGQSIDDVEVRETRLRFPVDARRLGSLRQARVESVGRRAKYLLVHLESRTVLLVHLGMTGNLLVCPPGSPLHAHDHVRWWLSGGSELRFRDPRRFGLVVVADADGLESHRLLSHLGVEPLSEDFEVDFLRRRAEGTSRPVKNFLMDARVAVGVGNIYASEALWRARVNPRTAAGRISEERWGRIRDGVRQVLADAIAEGGTTLSDFRDEAGNAGYFQVSLDVYDRAGEPCRRCGGSIRRIVQAGRATFYCTGCQH